MLKYTNTEVVFAEVPDEVTLAINISNCPNNCPNCHSPQLREDIGNTLDWGSLNALIHINKGITCVAFMGGDAEPEAVDNLAFHTKRMGIKTCWYSGNQELSDKILLDNFDYIKLGPYIEERGPLNSPTTNQKFYKVYHSLGLTDTYMEDITYKFQKQQGSL